jgi:hypothetical protein
MLRRHRVEVVMRKTLVAFVVLVAGCSSPAPKPSVDEERAARLRAEAVAARADWERERARRVEAYVQLAGAGPQVLQRGAGIAQIRRVFLGREVLGPRPPVTVHEVALAAGLIGAGKVEIVEVRRWTGVDQPVGTAHLLETLIVMQNGATVLWEGNADGGPNLSTDMLSYRGP